MRYHRGWIIFGFKFGNPRFYVVIIRIESFALSPRIEYSKIRRGIATTSRDRKSQLGFLSKDTYWSSKTKARRRACFSNGKRNCGRSFRKALCRRNVSARSKRKSRGDDRKCHHRFRRTNQSVGLDE